MTAEIFLTSRFGPDHSVHLAQVAERSGLGGVWLAEHGPADYGYGKCPDALALAARILEATTRIRIGTAACVYTNWDPFRLAATTAGLGPRFQLGVARGRDGDPAGFADWLSSVRAAYPGTVRVAAVSLSTVELAAKYGMPLLLGLERTASSRAEAVRHWTSITGYPSGDHLRVALCCPPSPSLAANLAEWLRGIGNPTRDLTAHRSHLLRTRADRVEKGMLCMVEQAGSVRATAELIEALGSMC